jgi:hypothetical protein
MAKKTEDRTIPSFAELFGEKGAMFFLDPTPEQKKKQKRAERMVERALERHFRAFVAGREKAARRKLARLIAQAMKESGSDASTACQP